MSEQISRVKQFEIMKALQDGPKIGTDIASAVQIEPISFLPNMGALEQNGFVEVIEQRINGTMTVRPFYELTELGQNVLIVIGSS